MLLVSATAVSRPATVCRPAVSSRQIMSQLWRDVSESGDRRAQVRDHSNTYKSVQMYWVCQW